MLMDRRRWAMLVALIFCTGLAIAFCGGWLLSLAVDPKTLFNCAVVFSVLAVALLWRVGDEKPRVATALVGTTFVFASEFSDPAPLVQSFSWITVGCIPLAWATMVGASRVEQRQRIKSVIGERR